VVEDHVNELPVHPLSIRSRLEHEDDLTDYSQPCQHWKASIFVDEAVEECAPWLRRIGEVNMVLVDLRDLDRMTWMGLGRVLDFLKEVVVEPATGVLTQMLERTLLPGPPGPPTALVVREIELSEAWVGFDVMMPLLASAMDMAASLARFAIVDTDPHTELRRLRFDDAEQREGLAEIMRLKLEDAGFGVYRNFHIASLHDPAYREHNAKIVIRWLIDRMTEV
jgi:hypothetical protein